MSKKVLWVFYDSLSKTQSNPISTEDAQMSILKMRPQQIERFLIWTAGWDNWKFLKSYLESNQKNFVCTFTVPLPKTRLETVTAVIKEILENIQPTKSQATNPHTTDSRTPPQENPNKNKPQSGDSKKEITRSYSNIHLNDDTFSDLSASGPSVGIADFDGNEATYNNIEKSNLDFSIINKKFRKRKQTELKIEILLISTKGKDFRSRARNISLSGSLLEDTIPFDYYGNKFDVVVINPQSDNPAKSRIKLRGTILDNNGGLTHRLHFCDMSALQKKIFRIMLEDYVALQKTHKAS